VKALRYLTAPLPVSIGLVRLICLAELAAAVGYAWLVLQP